MVLRRMAYRREPVKRQIIPALLANGDNHHAVMRKGRPGGCDVCS